MSTLRTISNFKSNMIGGGARPNLFEVAIPALPAAATAAGANWGSAAGEEQETFNFLCKAAQLPASSVSSIDVPFRGRIFKVAGDRTVENWTVTIINDENFLIRTAMEYWMNGIAKLDNNTGATNPASYMTNAFVSQLGRGATAGRSSESSTVVDGGASVQPLRVYTFFDLFPVNIGSIELSYDSSDTIEEYTVEFAVNNIAVGTDPQGTSDQTGSVIN